ncbi:MAG: phage integrase SAM-like domain-containing protein [Cyclobacteriaceae bacterium]
MAISLQIRSQGKSDPMIILNVFDSRFKGRKFMHSTGISIPQNLWDKRKGRVRITPGKEDELSRINQHLDAVEKSAIDFLSDKHNSNSLNREDLKDYLSHAKIDERKIKEEKNDIESSFYLIWQEFIDTAKNSKGEPIGAGTRKTKQQTLTLLKTYCEKKRIKLTFENIDMSFYHNFDLYMQEMPLNGNTRGRHFKEIKAILREAQERDFKVNLAYQKKGFKVIRNTPDNIYLNDTELKKISNLNLSKELSQHRDIFVMACFVGARQGDWHQISQSAIVYEREKEILKYRQEKTGDIVHIPVHPAVRRILDKYNGLPPRVISNQKFNEALKTIGRKAKLGTITINGNSVNKGSEISTHTARRSFATNAYLSRALDVHQIMKCTGHKSEAAFLKYLKLNGKDFAIEAADSKFFNDKSWVFKTVKNKKLS